MSKKLPEILIFSGLICLFVTSSLIWQRYKPLPKAITEVSNQTQLSSYPKEIIIPDININLPIIPTEFNKGKWKATTHGVSYLLSSPKPGEMGNSILYGHNWPNLLGNITKLGFGQTIQIKFTGGIKKDFIILKTKMTDQADTSILAGSDEPIITLYTCTGFFDRQRFVVVAKLKS